MKSRSLYHQPFGFSYPRACTDDAAEIRFVKCVLGGFAEESTGAPDRYLQEISDCLLSNQEDGPFRHDARIVVAAEGQA